MRTKNAFMVGLLSLALALLATPAFGAAVAPSSPDGGPSLDGPPSEHRGLAYSVDRAISQGVLNVQSGLLYDTIAAAVAAANAGDTLRIVAPAILEGAVTIDRDLTLEGADGDEIIFAAADTGSSGDARAWFLVDPGIDLTVRDLTFNGNGFRIYQAFRHKGTGSFDRVHFRDIQFDPSTAYQGTAIVAFGGVVNVRDSSFEEIGRVGVLFFGAVVSSSVAERNVYIGKGDGNFLDYGLEVGAGADVVLWQNHVSECRGIAGDGSVSSAILVSTFFGGGTAAVVESNQLLRNHYGLTLGYPGQSESSSVVAQRNRLVDNLAGVSSSSSQPLDLERNWWGCNAGPGATGCDGLVLGDGAVADADPWLVLSLSADGTPFVGVPLRIEGDLLMDSDGVDTSMEGTVADGIPVSFGGAPGTIAPSITATSAGRAESYFTASEAGPGNVSVTVDHQTVKLPTDVQELPLLFIREELPAATGTPLVVPVEFDGKGQPIAALAFSLDLDPACLAFDDTDNDNDGVPDSIAFQVPADFAPEVFVDLGDSDGELDFSFADVPPVAIIPDGVLVEITFDVICAAPPEIVPLPFSQAPAASFGDTAGASVPGLSTDGSFRLLDGLRGDCNADGVVDAGDFSACGLEIFDLDGDFWLDVPGGSFAGDPVGCDANADAVVDAGDIACKRRIAFAMPCVDEASGSGTPHLELPAQPSVMGGTASATLELFPSNRQLGSLVLALEVDPLQLDPASLVVTPISGVSVSTFDIAPQTLGLIIENASAMSTGALIELDFATTTGGAIVDALSVAEPALSFGSVDGARLDGVLYFESPALFADGFESGDLSAWATAVP